MGQGSTVRLRQPRGAGQTRDAASGFPRFGVAFPFTARPCSFSRCVLSPHPGEVVNSSKRPFRERSYQTHIRPSGRCGGAVALHLHCFSFSRWEKGAPRTGARSAKVLARGMRVVCFRRPAPDPHPTGEGTLHSSCTVFRFQSPPSRTPPMTHLCHPGSAAGAIRDGTESQAEARTARTTIRAPGSVAPSPGSASRLSGPSRIAPAALPG